MKSLRDTPDESAERAQVGIGTLIVFIAMVLVAAIAAGVLINTAGFLQTQAEATGEESTAQVANNLDVISTTGDANVDQDAIESVNMSVQLGAGSDAIDMEDATIEFLGDTAETLVHEDVGDTALNFTTTGVGDSDDTVLSNDSDRIDIGIDLTAAGTGLGELAEGESATVIITTGDGAQVTESLTVPNMIDRPTENL